jgi:hypothetical protein
MILGIVRVARRCAVEPGTTFHNPLHTAISPLLVENRPVVPILHTPTTTTGSF